MCSSSEFGKWLSHPPLGEEVVIAGVSGRFPESNNFHEFKENLFNKVDMVTDDDRRWKLDHPEVPQRSGKIYDINKMDAGYFGLHYRQADIMDPMTRKCLECAIEAIIDSGVNPSELEGSKTAVLVGASAADMEIETLTHITKPKTFVITGYLRSFMAHRISYFLKLKGPSCISDTACSSSMNALELAFKYIRMGKCDNAIVGGVNIVLHPGSTRQFFGLGVLSSDGTSKVFDQKADGYVRSETVASVFLQKAKDAKRIYSQVIYARINDDGFKDSGITFPSPKMQEELMNAVLQDSGIDANDIKFMEAHGTGTQVGDPQEVEAIDNAIARKRTEPLLIGSVKCSIGHTEPASGLCSVAKVIIAMETGCIPPNIHLKNIKKGLSGFEEGRMKAVTELIKLDRDDAIIGVNNFGFGGNNGHVLLKRSEKLKINGGLPEDDIPRLVCVSGRTKEAVLTLLDSITKTSLDNECVGLFHQIFKKDVHGHVYRGFTIVSKTSPVKTDVKNFYKRKSLRVFFGKFEKGHKVLGQYLQKFPCFQTTIHRVNKIVSKELARFNQFTKFSKKANNGIFASFVTQVAIIEIFKLLEIEAEAVYGDSIGKLVTSYYDNNITLEEAVYNIFEFIKKSEINNFQKNENSFDKNLKKESDLLILNISDYTWDNSLSLVEDEKIKFLEILGRLYEEGHNPQLHKIYPTVQFPVSRGTSMISPFIHWDYRKDWATFNFGKFTGIDITQREYYLTANIQQEQGFLAGHVIDGRNLIPAAQYLEIVRKTLVRSTDATEFNNFQTVFENCKFIKAVNLSKNEVVKLLVSIQKSSGNFEVLEKDSVVVSGRIFLTEDTDQCENDLPTNDIREETSESVLEYDEVYRELYLRGYNYTGLFKGIVRCNLDGSTALIKWDQNLTTFLDKMLQMKILQLNTRSLYVPVAIQRLTYNLIKHAKFTESQNDWLCPVFNNKETNVIKSGGIEICGVQATAIQNKKSTITPIIEKHIFVPNNTEIVLEDSIRVITQIILENSLENNFKSVEILNDDDESCSELVTPLLGKVLDDIPSVQVNLTISSQKVLKLAPGINVEEFVFTPRSNLLLIVATNLFQNQILLNQTLSALSPNGFFLLREQVNSVLEKVDDIEILTEHVVGNEKIILLQKTKQPAREEIIEITSQNFDWLPKLQRLWKKEVDIIVYSEDARSGGLLGFANCLRKEPKGNKVKCFFIMDSAPRFDITDPFYQTQIRKHMAINIYKGGKWGTYRHLLLQDLQKVEGRHFFLKNTIKNDLSSLKWVEGNLTPQTKLEEGSIVVLPVYASLNFKDIMIASGRVSVETVTADRIKQECCLGFEFCGFDLNGRRVMGMVEGAGMTTMVAANTNFLWEIPDNWSFQDAATVVVVYGTVIYSFLKVVQLKKGMSVLIHSATGGVGLAALNLCLYHGCDMYVTVGTQEKRDYLKKHFPQIPKSHIGNSRDTSFVEMIKIGTNGRGVDAVLNSLSEDKLKATIRCVASGGNFLEIGKFDLGNNASLSLLLLERNISYHGVMFDHIVSRSSEIKEWVFRKMNEGLKLGYVKPLPRTIFKRDEVIEAYKYMMTGEHIGKVIIQVRDENAELQQELFRGHPRFTCDPEKSYIIVGGLGGFGLELADWLYLRGVKTLILVSRAGIQSGYQKQRINFLRSCGITVHISTIDVTSRQECLHLIREADKLAPVDGIFNLAVVLKDALFGDQNEEAFRISLAPKAQATFHLDQITREFCPELRYFVVFSSVSCGRGNAGQTNYGMANSIMERICERRKSDGFSGLAIQWGAIGDVGLVAKMQKENRELVIGGTLQQKISSCLAVLDIFLRQDNPIVASMVVAEKSGKSDFQTAVDVVAYVLGIRDLKTVSPHTSFAELGMDSIMGTEIIQILEKDFEIYVTPKEIRSLTFAKLTELEDKIETNEKSAIPIKSDYFLRYIPCGDTADVPILELSSRIKDGENLTTVFVFPGIEGVFQGMEFLIGNLKAQLLGIQYNIHKSSIEEIAASVTSHIEETVSKEKTFRFIGHSFGALIAAEVTSLLEAKGFTGFLVLIEGSPVYLTKIISELFPTDNENDLQTLLIIKILSLVLPMHHISQQKDKFFNCKNFDERFELAISQVPPNLVNDKDLQKQTSFALYNRLKSIVDYNFVHSKIKSPVHLFKAKYSIISDYQDHEDYQLSEICEEKVQVTVLDGDHTSILDQNQLVDDINKLFKE